MAAVAHPLFQLFFRSPSRRGLSLPFPCLLSSDLVDRLLVGKRPIHEISVSRTEEILYRRFSDMSLKSINQRADGEVFLKVCQIRWAAGAELHFDFHSGNQIEVVIGKETRIIRHRQVNGPRQFVRR